MSFSPMCDDLDKAKRNRERDSAQTNEFYDSQARAVAQWELGKLKPDSVIVGELTYVGKDSRHKPDSELDTD